MSKYDTVGVYVYVIGLSCLDIGKYCNGRYVYGDCSFGPCDTVIPCHCFVDLLYTSYGSVDLLFSSCEYFVFVLQICGSVNLGVAFKLHSCVLKCSQFSFCAKLQYTFLSLLILLFLLIYVGNHSHSLMPIGPGLLLSTCKLHTKLHTHSFRHLFSFEDLLQCG